MFFTFKKHETFAELYTLNFLSIPLSLPQYNTNMNIIIVALTPTIGVLMASKEQGLVHAPFALLPSPVPQRCFEEALKLQTGFQAVVCKVAHDHDFLQQCLRKSAPKPFFHTCDIFLISMILIFNKLFQN